MPFTVKPAATADMKENFLTTDRKVMEHAFTGETVRAQIGTPVRFFFIFIKINMYGSIAVCLGETDIFQVKPV